MDTKGSDSAEKYGAIRLAEMFAQTLGVLSSWPPTRRFIWRAGRALYAAGRLDVPNSPATNGEYWLLRHAVENAQAGQVFLDIGANIGDWSAECLRAGAGRLGCTVHAFEPCPETHRQLSARLGNEVLTYQRALLDTEGTASFYELEPLGGTNSLHSVEGAERHEVTVSTVDRVLTALGTCSVKLMKVDTEGFDLMVLRGAASSLAAGNIEAAQIEYNWRWLQNNLSLRDLFSFAQSLPYRVGKLAGNRIELFDAWHPELDRFFESNFVLIRQGSALESLGMPMRFDRTNTAVRS